MIIGTHGAVVGVVTKISTHPNAEKVWLAQVRPGVSQDCVQIVFGGIRELHEGNLVPVALPGTRVIVSCRDKPKKMRERGYRGERSHGMLCSLRELGWVAAGLDEVAILKDLPLGRMLDDVPELERRRHVVNWFDA